jgi:hypothetical protein
MFTLPLPTNYTLPTDMKLECHISFGVKEKEFKNKKQNQAGGRRRGGGRRW